MYKKCISKKGKRPTKSQPNQNSVTRFSLASHQLRNAALYPLFMFTAFQVIVFLVSQPAARPPVQKAKSPAPQAPAGATSVKLGPKGAWLKLKLQKTYVLVTFTVFLFQFSACGVITFCSK